MNLFLSKHQNSIDKKGRVSVPASFRHSASQDGFNGIIIYPSIKHKCLEACGLKRFEQLANMIQNLEPFSVERDAFETTILGEAVQLTFDTEGRVNIPSHLVEYANIASSTIFVGKGQVFEIWQYELFEVYLAKARELAEKNKLLIKNI